MGERRDFGSLRDVVPGYPEKFAGASATRGLLAKLIEEAGQELAGLEQVVAEHISVIGPVLSPEIPGNKALGGVPPPVGSAVALHLMSLIAKTREIKERLIGATNRAEI